MKPSEMLKVFLRRKSMGDIALEYNVPFMEVQNKIRTAILRRDRRRKLAAKKRTTSKRGG